MIVIPMAGSSIRFIRAGYDRPKWMLPLAGLTLFDWSVLSFEYYFKHEPILFIYRRDAAVHDFIAQRCASLGVAQPLYAPLDGPTRGQAETVSLGLKKAGAELAEPITIFNIDTMRPGYRTPTLAPDVVGWLETFHGDGDHWSFVRPDEKELNLATEVTEKKRISPLCCSGLYQFATVKIFQDAFDEELDSPSMNELYVAPLYQRLIQKGLKVAHSLVEPEKIFFSGTPEEYENAQTHQVAILATYAQARGVRE